MRAGHKAKAVVAGRAGTQDSSTRRDGVRASLSRTRSSAGKASRRLRHGCHSIRAHHGAYGEGGTRSQRVVIGYAVISRTARSVGHCHRLRADDQVGICDDRRVVVCQCCARNIQGRCVSASIGASSLTSHCEGLAVQCSCCVATGECITVVNVASQARCCADAQVGFINCVRTWHKAEAVVACCASTQNSSTWRYGKAARLCSTSGGSGKTRRRLSH